MVMCFIDMNKELVRIKGKGGRTPLHLASEIGDVDILAELVLACPDSIEDVTVKGQTALHIAAENEKYEALHLLVYFLKKNTKRDASKLEYKILNLKDEDENTILHIVVENKEPEVLRWLVKTKINLKAMNKEGKTATDIGTTNEIKIILKNVGKLKSSVHKYLKVTDTSTLAQKIRSSITKMDATVILFSRIKKDISKEQRNIWLIIATLVATATYGSVLSPVGGVYQVSASDNDNNAPRNAGRSILSNLDFYIFIYLNTISFLLSTMVIIILTPIEKLGGVVLAGPIVWFILCYVFSMSKVSPNPQYATNNRINVIVDIVVLILLCCFVFYYRKRYNAKKRMQRS